MKQQPDLKAKRMERSGLILDPGKAKGQVNMTVMRADNGVLFSMVDVVNGCPIPMGDCVITWKDVPTLIERLQMYYALEAPKRYFLDGDPANVMGRGEGLK